MKKFLKITLAVFLLLLLVYYIFIIVNFKDVSEPTKQYIQKKFSYKEIFYFTTVGFGGEYNSTGDYTYRFIEDSITFKILGHPSKDNLRFLFKTIDTLNATLEYNHLHFEPDTSKPTSITIYFWTDEEWKKNMPDRYYADCLGCVIPRSFSNKILTKMDVILPTDRSKPYQQKFAILQEVTQVLGIFKDSEYEKHTVFSDYVHDTCYGPMDLACVKILYNSGLQPGVMLHTFEDALGITDEQTMKEQNNKKKSLFEIN